jgi:cyclopropane fatty-acyl-phospholipid synthase-like methyltransferase
MLRYKVSESLSASDFIRIGRGCAQIIAENMGKYGAAFGPNSRVLDFGCGCGRAIIWLSRNYKDVEFHGVDIDAQAIRWCSANLTRAHFAVNRALPPLSFPDQYFDAVYCLSVFTHLNEEMQDAWLSEFHRIIKRGGVLLITVHGRNAAKGLTAQDLAVLESAGILHKTSKKLRGIFPEWYHTTWHSRSHIEDHLSRWFQDVSYVEIPDGSQDLAIGRNTKI